MDYSTGTRSELLNLGTETSTTCNAAVPSEILIAFLIENIVSEY